MPRAKPTRTQYPGVYKRETTHGTVYDFVYRVSGKQVPIRGKHTSAKAANKHRIRLLNEARSVSSYYAEPTTLAEFVASEWLPRQQARVAEDDLRSSTLAQYARDVRNHLLPALGNQRLDLIDVEKVEQHKDKLLRDGLSRDTVRRIENTLGYVLKHARKKDLIRHNPVSDADKPAPRRRKPDLPTLAQLYQLADSTGAEEAGRLILFAAFTGLRLSELFGLRWSNACLTYGAERVLVVEQFYKGEHVPHAKSQAGNREVLLGDDAAAVLNEQAVAQQVNSRPNELGLVFPSPTGKHWHDSNWNRRVWQPARERAGLPELRFHTLRYFYNSHIRALGLPNAVTEQIVGHTDERTHRGYTRPIEGMEQLIRDAQAGHFARPTETDSL